MPAAGLAAVRGSSLTAVLETCALVKVAEAALYEAGHFVDGESSPAEYASFDCVSSSSHFVLLLVLSILGLLGFNSFGFVLLRSR